MCVVGRSQQQRRRVDRAARDDDERGADPDGLAVALDVDGLDLLPRGIGDEADRAARWSTTRRCRPRARARCRTPRRRSWRGSGTGRSCRCCTARSRPARRVESIRAAGARDGAPVARSPSTIVGHAGSVRNRRVGKGPARRFGRIDCRARRARGRAARRDRSTARACRSRSATPARRRPCARPPESPRAAADRARCPRTSCCRRRRSACREGTPGPARRASARSRGSAGASTRPRDSSCPVPEARASPRSTTRMRAGLVASARAMVPPPAPLPMMMTS